MQNKRKKILYKDPHKAIEMHEKALIENRYPGKVSIIHQIIKSDHSNNTCRVVISEWFCHSIVNLPKEYDRCKHLHSIPSLFSRKIEQLPCKNGLCQISSTYDIGSLTHQKITEPMVAQIICGR